MSQGENQGNLPAEETATEAPSQETFEEIDSLPIDSIGSYARLEESSDDETAENAGQPVSNG